MRLGKNYRRLNNRRCQCMNSDPGKNRRLILVCTTSVLVLVCFGLWVRERAIYRFIAQDRIWASKVRKQINPEEARALALSVLAQADPYGPVTEHQTFLTNAPSYLLNNYRHQPYVIHGIDCVHLSYGGGMYSWGLTIGPTNMPGTYVRGQRKEKWADGIYFWIN